MPDASGFTISVTTDIGLPEVFTVSASDLKQAVIQAPELLIQTVSDILRRASKG